MNSKELKQFDLLSELDQEDRDAILDVLEERKVSAGVPLFREGSESEGLILLVEGEISLESRRNDEQCTAGPGTVLGSVSLLVVGPREVTVLAVSPCRYLLFPRTSFRRLVDDAPRTACRLAEAVLAELAGRLRDGLDRFASA